MRKSARVLGQEYGLTAQEMNFLLKEEGYLSGEPGGYSVSEKGERYADEQDHSRGTGGYARYNRAWTTRTWDDGITDELDVTEDRKREIRQALSAAKRRAAEQADEESEASGDTDGDGEDTERGGNDALAAAVGAVLVAVSAYGVYKALPHARKFLHDKAVPRLRSMKKSVPAKRKGAEGAAGERDSPHPEGDH